MPSERHDRDVSTPDPRSIAREIEQHHQLLQTWLSAPCDPGTWESFAAAHAPEFSMVTVDGEVVTLATLLARLSRARNTRAGLSITVHEIETLVATSDIAVARFTEVHHDRSTTARRVTAVLQPDSRARNGLVWRHVHETATAPGHD